MAGACILAAQGATQVLVGLQHRKHLAHVGLENGALHGDNGASMPKRRQIKNDDLMNVVRRRCSCGSVGMRSMNSESVTHLAHRDLIRRELNP